MKEFFSSKKFKIILCIAAVCVGIMIYTAVASQSVLSSALGTVLAPIQKLTQNVTSSISDTFNTFMNAKEYFEENKELKEEIARLTAQMVDYIETKQENEHLREMVALSESNPGIEFSEPCTVIGRTANDVYGSFFIDKGEKDGISYYDPVVTANGLVGFVTEVNYTYSKVTTILSNEISIGVYCVRTGETGVIEGNYDLALERNVEMIYIPLECQMTDEDIVITSGYSGLVPKGLVVGSIGNIEIAPSGLSKTARISPSVDSSSLKTVYVITNFEGKGSGYEE